MTWTVRWHLLAERDFYDLRHWQTAERIDAALHTASGVEHRLLVPPYFVRISRDRATRMLHVWRIVRYA